jgi:glycerophosphoryl diester phosphodiesterase
MAEEIGNGFEETGGDDMWNSHSNGKIMVVAHRGGAGLKPENTTTAFAMAEEIGADAIELDVRLSSDRKIVVIHDPDLFRVFGDRRRVSEMTYDEIAKVKLPGGENPPELEAVLRDFNMEFFVEVKVSEVVQPIIELFQNNPRYARRCRVISFIHESVKIIKDQVENIETGALRSGLPADPAAVTRACRADFLSLEHGGVDAPYVDLCHSWGIPVNVWTVNSENDIYRMISSGVDSITSDRPDLVLKVLSR